MSGAVVDEGIEAELFAFASLASVDNDSEGIVRYLVSLVADDTVAKKIVALEILQRLLERDAPTREKILVHKLLHLLIALMPQVTGAPLNELLGIRVLRVLAFLCEHHSSILQSDDAKKIYNALISLSKSPQIENEQIFEAIGSVLAPFYRDRTLIDSAAFDKEPIKCALAATVIGKARLHREIPVSEIDLHQEIFQSPLCKVYRGRWQGSPADVAVKKFSLYSLGFTWEDFYKEVGLLMLAQHPNVVTLHGAFAQNGKTEEPFIVFEYLSKGDLHDYTVEHFKLHPDGFPILRLIDITLDIAKALSFVHQLGIIHRDIKTSNFLVADNLTVKMIDFGVSRIATSSLMTCVGTPTFMAPEVLSGDAYAASADVYSFAMVMYELYTGKEPFHDVQSLQLPGKVIGGLRPPVTPSAHPTNSGFLTLMQQSWDKSPLARPLFRALIVGLYQLKKNHIAAPPTQAPSPPAALQHADSVPTGLKKDESVRSTNPEDYDWYWGNISKDASVNLLNGKPTGTFLVRSSSREGCYAASVVFPDGIRHILIQPGENGRYVVDALDNKNYNFKSIPAVVKGYVNILVTPVPRENAYGIAPPPRQTR
jgi:serine/threonine protein kinase